VRSQARLKVGCAAKTVVGNVNDRTPSQVAIARGKLGGLQLDELTDLRLVPGGGGSDRKLHVGYGHLSENANRLGRRRSKEGGDAVMRGMQRGAGWRFSQLRRRSSPVHGGVVANRFTASPSRVYPYDDRCARIRLGDVAAGTSE